MPQYGIEENVSAPAAKHADCTASPCTQSPASASPDEHVLDSTSDGESLSSTPVLMTPVSKCGSVGFSLGTPIESTDAADSGNTPYATAKSLPDRSLFAVGVSDHILYENLPNATGTFKRLREVIRSLHSSSPASTASLH